MAKGFKGPGMGRPPIEWSEEKVKLFEQLMGIPFVSEEAVCDVLKVSISSLNRWLKKTRGVTFDEYKKQKHQGLKLKLAGKQYESAIKGSVPMMIWLGKQWLGQSDKTETKLDVTNLTDAELDQKIKELEGNNG